MHTSELLEIPFVTDRPHTLRVQLDQMNGDPPSVVQWVDRGEEIIPLPLSVARQLAHVLVKMVTAAEAARSQVEPSEFGPSPPPRGPMTGELESATEVVDTAALVHRRGQGR
jgi:xanthine dehydrogenase molybdopterin-binding subunit B